MITCLRQPTLSRPKQIPMQSLLYKTTTCLARPATTFFVSQMKKVLSKTYYYKILPSEEMGNNYKTTVHQNKRFSDYIYSIATLIRQSLCRVFENHMK